MPRWFEQHRQEWIADILNIFGFINRRHLERKFGISTAQAAVDLRHFRERFPDQVIYNRVAKRYELKDADARDH